MADERLDESLAVDVRGEEIYRARHQSHLGRTDQLLSYLLLGQWAFGIFLALVISPYAWEGRERVVHFHVTIALVLGGLITLFPVALARKYPGEALTRYMIAVAQMLWSALLIHLTGGRIETHFHVFGSLAFLAFYRDWKVLVPATVVIATDHLLRQILWPESVFGVVNPEPWRFLEHAGWVAFEDFFLVLACLSGAREMRDMSMQQARIEFTEKLEREMEIATRIQTAVLPVDPEVAGLEISARMLPAQQVGGDYYDVLSAPDGCWIGIGDVSGHGLIAGLVMLQAQSAVKALVQQNPARSPAALLADVNTVIYGNVHGRLGQDEHMTMTLVRYYHEGRLVMAGAHEPVFVCRAADGKCERVKSKGTWLGVVPDISSVTTDVAVTLAEDDVVVMYTDGLTEATNDQGEAFGARRLCDEIERAFTFPVHAIREHLFDAVKSFSSQQRDDITVMVFRHRGAVEQSAPTSAA